MHHGSSNSSMTAEEATRGVAVEKFDIVKKWGFNTYKVCQLTVLSFVIRCHVLLTTPILKPFVFVIRVSLSAPNR